MNQDGQGKAGLLRTDVVRGEPYQIGERTLIPEARIVSVGKARARIGAREHGGWGAAFTQVTPTALVEETENGERRIPIEATTDARLRGMLAAALVLTLFFTALRGLACLLKED